ncbi:MAG TPA: sulfurtransferase [Bacillota bacterium]
MVNGASPFGPLVDVDWLRRQAPADDLVIFDARAHLTDPEEGRRLYLEAHIPGALHLDLKKDLSAPPGQGGGRHPLPDPQILAAKLGRLGVDQNSRIVVYDDGSGHYAARAWWVLEYLGLDRVAVLDGGFAAWLAAGGPTSSGSADEERALSRPPRTWQPQPRRERVRDREAIRRWLDQRPADVYLVDARAPERYRGEQEPIDPVAGHIPGAVNLPHRDLLGPDGRWLGPHELRRRLGPLRDAREVIVYCGSGVSACANLLAMRLAGLDNGVLYPGSWSDWCSDPDAPVERG